MKRLFRFLAKPVPRRWEIARDYNDGDYLKCAVLVINLLMFIYAAGLVVASLVRFGLHGGFIDAVKDGGSQSPELFGGTMHIELIYILFAMGILSIVLLVIRFFRTEESRWIKILVAIGSAGTVVFGGLLIYFLTHAEVAIKVADKMSGKLGYMLIGGLLLFFGIVVIPLLQSTSKEVAGAFMPILYFVIFGPFVTLMTQNLLVLLVGAVMGIVIIAGIGFFATIGDGVPSGGGSSSSGGSFGGSSGGSSSRSKDREKKRKQEELDAAKRKQKNLEDGRQAYEEGWWGYNVDPEVNRRAREENQKRINDLENELRDDD